MKKQPVIVNRQVEELIPYIRNSRTHSDAQVAQVAASIREFGWTNPVLIDGENGTQSLSQNFGKTGRAAMRWCWADAGEHGGDLVAHHHIKSNGVTVSRK